jgi:hypothetical protein
MRVKVRRKSILTWSNQNWITGSTYLRGGSETRSSKKYVDSLFSAIFSPPWSQACLLYPVWFSPSSSLFARAITSQIRHVSFACQYSRELLSISDDLWSALLIRADRGASIFPRLLESLYTVLCLQVAASANNMAESVNLL